MINEKNSNFIMKYGPMSSSDLDLHIHEYHAKTIRILASRLDLKDHHIDKLMKSADIAVRYELGSNQIIKDNHIDELIDRDTNSVPNNKNLKDHHIEKIIKHSSVPMKMELTQNLNLKDHHIRELAKDPDEDINLLIKNHPRYKEVMEKK